MNRFSLQLLFAIVITAGCKENFEPPAIQKSVSALVVDGFLNNSPDTTFIRLSRTKKLSEGVLNSQEKGAQLSVEDASGNTIYYFQELNDSGTYSVPGMSLAANNKYRLRINTANGNQYLSDEIPVLKTPLIDSISFENTGNGVSIYVNSHDPQNNTHYYRWAYSETWQYHAAYFASLIYQDGILRIRDPSEYVYECWRTQQSTQILIGSSAKLAEDIIYHFPFRKIEQDALELSEKYFVSLKQYALTKESFEYMENLKKISEQTGSIFDAQPNQSSSNIHAVNTNEVVIGYLVASTEESKQLYITNAEVQPWHYSQDCQITKLPLDQVNDALGKQGLSPISMEGLGPTAKLLVSQHVCTDCTMKGGVTTKPDFWQ